MYDIHRMLREQLRSVMRCKQTLIFPEGEDPRIITAASRLTELANLVLLGSSRVARDLVERGEVELACSSSRFFSTVRFLDTATDELAETLAEGLRERSVGKHWELSRDEAAEKILDPVYYAIMAVHMGYADAVIGGVAHKSRDFFTPCLRILEKEGVVYEMGLFVLPDDHPAGLFEQNLVMFSDVALTPVPTPEALTEIAVGACRTMRDLIPMDVLPEINGAVLSYSTRGSGLGPSVERIRAAEPMIQERLSELAAADPLYESIHIVTEMQISAALSEDVARSKLEQDFPRLRGAGRANVLIVPSLDVGNLLYHIYATRYPEARSTLVIGGMHDQALDFSRSSTPDELVRGAMALLLRRARSERFECTPHDHFFPRFRILTINPGSTSTKVALFEGEEPLASTEIHHPQAELKAYPAVIDQLPMRRAKVREFLASAGCDPADLHAVVGRGGLLRPISGGTYLVDEPMRVDLTAGFAGEHPANLGGLIAGELADEAGIPAYIVDPPVADELDPLFRRSGLAGHPRRPAWHALSQKSAARSFASARNREVEEMNLIVAHLGGGISVGAHRHGRCVLVENALLDGPMSPRRAGTLPTEQLIELCYSGIPREELTRRLINEGGLVSHLGTHDLVEVERRIEEGDEEARHAFEAMGAQIAGEIARLVPAFGGERVDALILTGGMCRSRRLCSWLLCLLTPLGIEITVMAGTQEQEALRDGALAVLRGREQVRTYAE